MNQIIHFDNTNTARFVTFSCYHNYNLIKSDSVRMIFVKHLDRLRKKDSYKIYGYVIMTNHVHIVIHPSQDILLSKIIGELKSMTAREIIDLWQTMGMKIFDKLKIYKNGKERFAFWQKRYYDHNCRTKEKTIEKINYCHNNPVKKGLVEKPSQWRWSSYRWYNGMDDVLIDMDRLE